MNIIESAATKLCNQAVRRNEFWIGGPTGSKREPKSRTMDLSDFLELVWKVEKAAGDTKKAIQWLRRLSYSKPLGGAGAIFDRFIHTDPSRLGAPVTTLDLPRAMLDLLVRTGTVRIPWEQRPEHQIIDVSHVFVLLDLKINGPSLEGKFFDAEYNLWPLHQKALSNHLESILSWAADLASIWLGFIKLRRVAKLTVTETLPLPAVAVSWLETAIQERNSREDILGDLDAVILAHQELPQSKTPITALLDTYYQPGHSTETEPRVLDRFNLFCTRARPAILCDISSSGQVTLKPEARKQLEEVVREASILLLGVAAGKVVRTIIRAVSGLGPLGGQDDEDLASVWASESIRLIADRFFEFLSDELTGRQGKWPLSPFDEKKYIFSGYQGGIALDSEGLPLLPDLEAYTQYYLNWKNPNKRLRKEDDVFVKSFSLVDPNGTEATVESETDEAMTHIRIERFVRLDDIVSTSPDEALHPDLLYLESDVSRPSKKYKITMIDQKDSIITVEGIPSFSGFSKWRIIRCPRIVLIDPWAGRVGGEASTLEIDPTGRSAIRLVMSDVSAGNWLSQVNANLDSICIDYGQHEGVVESSSTMFWITQVHPDQPVVYLDEPLRIDGLGSWRIPAGAVNEIQPSPYQMTPKDDGCDHYDGRAFVVFDGKIRYSVRCTSYASMRARAPRKSSAIGNKTLFFQSKLSTNAFRNFSLMIYDSVDASGIPIDSIDGAQFFFVTVSANRKPTRSILGPFPVPDQDGKSQIRFHYGLPSGSGTESEGCMVSPEFYELRAMLCQLYNTHCEDLGGEEDKPVSEIGHSRTHTESQELWQSYKDRNSFDHWSERLRGQLILVRPSQTSLL